MNPISELTVDRLMSSSRAAQNFTSADAEVRDLYLYAFATRHELSAHVRAQATEEEADKLPEIIRQWESIQPAVRSVVSTEKGLPESIRCREVPPEYQSILKSYSETPMFGKGFSGLPISIALVEADKLVAGQRHLSLAHVRRIISNLKQPLDLEGIIELALGPSKVHAQIRHRETDRQSHIFSSPSLDMRYLGTYRKQITADDLRLATFGGVPMEALITFIGFGTSPISAFRVGDRVVLNNGFHRVFALRTLGITEVPVVLQHVQNPALEFPPIVASLPRDYLLGAQRPAVIKDFFSQEFTMLLKMRSMLRIINVSAANNMQDVPL